MFCAFKGKGLAKEVRDKTKLDHDSETFSLVEDHQILYFRSKADYVAILKGGTWFAAS